MKAALVVGMIFLAVFIHITRAQNPQPREYSGNDLLRDCTTQDSYSFCLGYITGLEHGISLESQYRKSKPMFSLPSNVEMGQLVDLVVKALKERPEQRHMKAAVLALAAIVEAFPPKE
jgi:hypothetical protein